MVDQMELSFESGPSEPPIERAAPLLETDGPVDLFARKRDRDGAEPIIYDEPSADPAIRAIEEAITRATNSDSQVRAAMRSGSGYGAIWDSVNMRESIHRWINFVTAHPEQAQAYAQKGHVEIRRALQWKEKQQNEARQARSVAPETESSPVSTIEEVGPRIQGQISEATKNLTLDDLKQRRQNLSERPQIDAPTLVDTLVGIDQNAKFTWISLDKVVGRTFEQPEGWASENDGRKGRIVQLANVIINGNDQSVEPVFHAQKPNERIQLTAIDGPVGPMYYVDDGTHRVAASMVAGLTEIPCDVKRIKYPLETYATDQDQAEYWQRCIELGLIDGDIQDHVSPNGRAMKKLIVRGEVLPWIRTTRQSSLMKISRIYEQLYPGSLDHLKIPKQALINPVANNFFMTGKWGEWLELEHQSQIS